MSLPEIRPLTTDPFPVQLTPAGWRTGTHAARIVAHVRPLDYLELRDIEAKSTSAEQRVDLALAQAVGSVECAGRPLVTSSLPASHLFDLVNLILTMSMTGADPFVEPPAASSP